MTLKLYEATLLEPARYSSREGRVIESDPRISATAVMHALAYKYNLMEKQYLMVGEDATNPDYSTLADLPFFTSDLTPVDAVADDYTFRSTTHPEHSLIVDDKHSDDLADSKTGFPRQMKQSRAGWHRQREFIEINRGSEYALAVWDDEDVLPDTLKFDVGISRDGLVKAERTESVESVTLNRYLLGHVYDIQTSDLTSLLSACDGLVRGNDPRLHAFKGLDIDVADEFVQEYILN
jgi:CRISPR-associated protein Csc1